MITIYLSKQQSLDADPKAIQQILRKFRNRWRCKFNKVFFFLLNNEKAVLYFSQVTAKVF